MFVRLVICSLSIFVLAICVTLTATQPKGKYKKEGGKSSLDPTVVLHWESCAFEANPKSNIKRSLQNEIQDTSLRVKWMPKDLRKPDIYDAYVTYSKTPRIFYDIFTDADTQTLDADITYGKNEKTEAAKSFEFEKRARAKVKTPSLVYGRISLTVKHQKGFRDLKFKVSSKRVDNSIIYEIALERGELPQKEFVNILSNLRLNWRSAWSPKYQTALNRRDSGTMLKLEDNGRAAIKISIPNSAIPIVTSDVLQVHEVDLETTKILGAVRVPAIRYTPYVANVYLTSANKQTQQIGLAVTPKKFGQSQTETLVFNTAKNVKLLYGVVKKFEPAEITFQQFTQKLPAKAIGRPTVIFVSEDEVTKLIVDVK